MPAMYSVLVEILRPGRGSSWVSQGSSAVADAATTPASTTTTTTPVPLAAAGAGAEEPAEGAETESRKGRSASGGEDTLKPISIKMLQGAFYALLAGYLLAGEAEPRPFIRVSTAPTLPNSRGVVSSQTHSSYRRHW